jgi:hypothetical protein
MNDDKIVVYESFPDPIKANIVKGLLNSYGIECFLSDELMVTLNVMYGPAIGGVKLNVFEKDMDRIQAILKSENSEPEPDQSIENGDSNVVCPNCHSSNLSYGTSAKKKFGLWIALIFSFIFTFPLRCYPFTKRKAYHCFDCNGEFNKP